MLKMKCGNCGGEMSVDPKGGMACPFCGSKQHFSDPEFRGYREFRLKLLDYLRSAADEAADAADASFLPSFFETETYYTENGTQVRLDHLFCFEDDGVKTYVTKNSVVSVFSAADRAKADKMLRGLSLLDYPSAALKDQSRYFPSIKSRFSLNDGGLLLALEKPENAFPLYAFGDLQPEHAAWIVSRLENACCILAYSDLTHGAINPQTVYVNPRTHEAFLLGGWWHAAPTDAANRENDLTALRRTAEQTLGRYLPDAPEAFRAFLKSRPAKDAYTDFEQWDESIEKGFGGRRFVKFSTK